GLQTGDTVYYQNGANTPIAGLTGQQTDPHGQPIERAYGVVNFVEPNGTIDPNNISLGAVFSGAESSGNGGIGVDSATDTINFAAPHNFQSGDQVVFEGFTPAGGGPVQTIGGLTPGATYYVEVVTPSSIRLTNTYDQAVNPQNYLQNFTPSQISGSTITLPSAPGFSNNEAVTYYGPQPSQFSSSTVNVNPVAASGGGVTFNAAPGANNIYIYNGTFNAGDSVLYQTPDGGTPIGGLTPGTTYKVYSVSSSVQGQLVQLGYTYTLSNLTFTKGTGSTHDKITLASGSWPATLSNGEQIKISGTSADNGTYTIGSISGGILTLSSIGSLPNGTAASATVDPQQALTLTPSTSGSDASVVQTLIATYNLPIMSPGQPGGVLQQGTTYYVTNLSNGG
ncbi:MAG: hypothetical protein P4L86_26345, partial [Mycobacterium sp.]|nr:hypothetical protein [Mycobacterium sp.]